MAVNEHHIHFVPRLEESTITAGKSPSSGNQTPKQLLSLPTLSRNPATSKQSHDENMTPDKKVAKII